MNAKTLNFIERGGRHYLSVAVFADGSDGTDMDALDQKYRLGVTDSERDNKVVVMTTNSVRAISRKAVNKSLLATDLAAFSPQFNNGSATQPVVVSQNGEPYTITPGSNDELLIAIDDNLPVPVTIPVAGLPAGVVGSNAEPFTITTGTNDHLSLLIDNYNGSSPLTVTLTPAGTPATCTGSLVEPFVVATGVNDTLSITVGGLNGGNPVTITLPAGSLSASDVGSAINTAFASGIAAAPSGHVSITSIQTGGSAIITIHAGNANATIGFSQTDFHGGYTPMTATEVATLINSAFGQTVAADVSGSVHLFSVATGPAARVYVENFGQSAAATLGFTFSGYLGSYETVTAQNVVDAINSAFDNEYSTVGEGTVNVVSPSTGYDATVEFLDSPNSANATIGFTVGKTHGSGGLTVL